MSIADEIGKLNALKNEGAISAEEYEQAKQRLLAQQEPPARPAPNSGTNLDENMWAMLVHLTQFCGWVIPGAGLVVPIILWQTKKDEIPNVDRHGRIVANWIITEVIFGVIFGLLCLILIGIPLIVALGVVGVVFPIIGGIKANNGEVWPYPLSIKFFALPQEEPPAAPPPPGQPPTPPGGGAGGA